MKTIKFFTFILVAGLITACGGGNKKSEQITEEALVGRWQPEKLEFRDIPAIFKKQISKEDLEKQLLSDSQKKGYLEFREDGTFTLQDTPSDEGYVGNWSFDGNKTIGLETPLEGIKLSFHVISVSGNSLEIDYASMYKTMAGLEKVPFFDLKMVMSYKRVK